MEFILCGQVDIDFRLDFGLKIGSLRFGALIHNICGQSWLKQFEFHERKFSYRYKIVHGSNFKRLVQKALWLIKNMIFYMDMAYDDQIFWKYQRALEKIIFARCLLDIDIFLQCWFFLVITIPKICLHKIWTIYIRQKWF